jgi:VWFA-related protein
MRATVRWSLSFPLATFVLIAPAGRAQQAAQQPTFKSGVELVIVDAQVVDKKKGDPIPGLKAEQFQVTIDGKKRKVASAQFIDSATGQARTAEAPSGAEAAPPAGGRLGNLYVLAVDQGSFRAANAAAVIYATRELLKRLHPSDYLAVISFPAPGVRIDPTRDRKVLEEALPRLVGLSQMKQNRRYQFGLADAIDAAARDAEALRRVVERNCPAGDQMCARSVEIEMNELVSMLELQAARSLHGLRDVVDALKGVEGRKTLVVVSAGIPTGDRSGGRLYMRSDVMQLAKEAQMSGVLLYTLHLNTAFLDAFSPDAPSLAQTAMREANVYARGLDLFNGNANGTFFEVNTGANFAIDRMVREMSAHYLLGVEVDDADRDGRPHLIQVKVSQGDSAVRNRASVVIPKRGT